MNTKSHNYFDILCFIYIIHIYNWYLLITAHFDRRRVTEIVEMKKTGHDLNKETHTQFVKLKAQV